MAENTKVLINAVGIAMGGGARHLPKFLNALHEARPGWVMDVCCDARTRVSDLPEGVGIVPFVGSGTGRRLWWDLVGVDQAARDAMADCVINLANYGPLSPSVPSILYQRNALFFDPSWLARAGPSFRSEAGLRRALAFKEMAASDVIVTPSDAMAGFLRSWRACDDRWRLVTVPHGVDSNEFPYRPRAVRLDGAVRMLSTSLPAPHKDVPTLIRATAELRRRKIDASLVLTIEGRGYSKAQQPDIDALDRLARRLRIHEHVQFLGTKGDVRVAYEGADVLLSASYTESFGFPLLEGMACGMPVVASAIPASMEVLGELGWYFLPGDHRGLASRILELGSLAEDQAVERVRSAHERAIGHTWEKNATAIAALVEGLLERPR